MALLYYNKNINMKIFLAIWFLYITSIVETKYNNRCIYNITVVTTDTVSAKTYQIRTCGWKAVNDTIYPLGEN